ncbi:GntR family transcriptional regulator [Aquamicrobium defluvii]|uniref:GntR family transcriptional regulator n=1 Tax=Aquamicrobium defluvii TaxID=69279 RepID=A0A011TEY7_9HYPH|nr:GntR family transcriptional regulator [Aquamicrobium defluvii]EXL02407.1 GntR family transcriptional regulator [Aquamicrobium defluvii]EZQ13099.1 GntR family transcriptional regulator [Halopseudomonas bauzanensis]TDR32908.1 GntR family transcriptional regulator [Aquamicrobium defluvii]
MNIQPLEQGNLSARAYIALREGLISGQFRPGQRLVMQDLAEKLGTSVTPVREACLRLVSERGLELRSGRFVTVPPMTLARYMEVRTIRLSLEGLAAGLAAETATEEEIDRLVEIQTIFEKVDRAGDPEDAFRYNRDFHFAVYRLSRMDMLVAHIESLWVSMGPMLTVFFKEGEHKYIGAAEHQNVIAALRERKPARARTAIERDLILGGEDFLRFLRTHEEFAVS